MRILVIDDDDSVRSAVRRALPLAGYVIVAATGEEGLLTIGTELPDAIVLDLGLPDIDGMEVCRRRSGDGDRRVQRRGWAP
ncbi:MAG: response regulator [Solirubrobacteraceae bacterium]